VRSQVQILDGPHGGIAQLVERCLCKADVRSSSLLTSIDLKKKVLKKLKACKGSLGIQKRRRTWLPAKRFGELEVSFDPKISE
jgi:hypothetical protein